MPLVKIQASVPVSAGVDELLKTLSAKLAKHLGKPESYVMTVFEADVKMSFAGTFDPVCYMEIKSIGKITPQGNKAISQDFCQEIESRLGIPKNRIYIEFADADAAMWGWNGSTFGSS